jgi:hypothetical protein
MSASNRVPATTPSNNVATTIVVFAVQILVLLPELVELPQLVNGIDL